MKGGQRTGAEAVRHLWERFEARDWDGAAEVLGEDVVIDWPASRERIVGRDNVIGLNRDYPEPWGTISVLRLFEADEEVAAEVRVQAQEATYFCVGFYEVRDSRIVQATEYWVTEGGDVPEFDRSRWVERT